jgi:hypothetical protein
MNSIPMPATKTISVLTGADVSVVIAASTLVPSAQVAAMAYSRLRPSLQRSGVGVGVDGEGNE